MLNSENHHFGLKTYVAWSEKRVVEIIAMLLLIPLISFSSGEAAPEEARASDQRPVVGFAEGRWTITPPEDQTLTMTVLESRPSLRSPASVEPTGRRIDVIVSAP